MNPVGRCAQLQLSDDAAEQPRPRTGIEQFYSRIASSYREGYEKSRTRLREEQQAFFTASGESALRPQDRIAGAVVAAFLVEAATFGAALAGSWLVLGAPLLTEAPQARLRAAFDAAVAFRASTRLPRLLLEVFALPAAVASVAKRPAEERFTFCQERATQALAIIAAVVMTLRALNSGVLRGTTGPAIVVLASKFGLMLSPLTSISAISPISTAVSSAAHGACSKLVAIGHAAVSLDDAARQLPLLRSLYDAAELERYLGPPFGFACACLRAFYEEVLLTGLRRLGFVTLQTLG